MIRLLMAGTALAAVLGTAAIAQDSSSSSMMASSSMQMDNSMASSATMDSSMMSSQMSTASSIDNSMMSSASSMMAPPATRTPITLGAGYTQVDTDQLATKIIGQPVYDGGDDKADNVGKISDLVLNGNGDVAAVVIGVGGFLGLGEKQVAVDFSALQIVVATDGTKRFVVKTTKDELTSAPDFKTVDVAPSQAVSDMSMSSSSAQ